MKVPSPHLNPVLVFQLIKFHRKSENKEKILGHGRIYFRYCLYYCKIYVHLLFDKPLIFSH